MADLVDRYVKGKTKKTTKEKLEELKKDKLTKHLFAKNKEIAGSSKSVKSKFTYGLTPKQKKAGRFLNLSEKEMIEQKKNPDRLKKYKKLKTKY